MVSLPASSQENVKQKSTFTFTFTLHTIYEVNDIDQYLERCWPNTDNDAILAVFLHHEENNFSKLTVKNRSQQIRYKQMVDQLSSGMICGYCCLYPNRRQLGYLQRCSARLGAAVT